MRRPHPTGSDFARIGEVEGRDDMERGESEAGVLLSPGGVIGRVLFFRVWSAAVSAMELK